MIRQFNIDCIEHMKTIPDKHYDLAIVDPPYGIDINMNMGRRQGMGVKHKVKKWDNTSPEAEYFTELFRISKNQIIWGGNYFYLKPCRGFIVWDKLTTEDLSFSMCEFAWSSFDMVSKILRLPIQTENNDRIHPTQKPIKLYKWLLKNYAKEGDKIFDSHGGSGSIMIACDEMGFDLDWCELDKDYFDAAVKRFNDYKKQLKLEL